VPNIDGTVDLYAVLGLDDTADDKAVNQAFRALAKKLHPDSGGDAAAFDEIVKAKEILTDEFLRSDYRLRRRQATAGARGSGPSASPPPGQGQPPPTQPPPAQGQPPPTQPPPEEPAPSWAAAEEPAGLFDEMRAVFSLDGQLEPGLGGWLGRPFLTAASAAFRAAAAGLLMVGLWAARSAFDPVGRLGFGLLPEVTVPLWLAAATVLAAVCVGPRASLCASEYRGGWLVLGGVAAGVLLLDALVAGGVVAAALWARDYWRDRR
jgi:hypothetical protein